MLARGYYCPHVAARRRSVALRCEGVDSESPTIIVTPSPSLTRTAQLARLGQRRFDVLVIGGGITGAGIARDAARRGLDVALVERDDFASGTSSRSSRLVHGGVRYLEYGHLRLVFESCHERRVLLRIAPHLVRPLAFTWPVYEGARIPRWKLRAGLLLYDLLALFRNVAPHRGLTAEGIAHEEPMLACEGLRGGARYFDAATDDARLTLATMLDAAVSGATVLNHAEVTALREADGRVCGVTVRDRLGGRTLDINASCVVNATGPWTDVVRRMEDPAAPPAILGSKGVHIAVPASRVGNRGAVTLLASDGRVMFVLPAGLCTIIGTTETETHEAPDHVRAARADVDYLIASANRAFPAAALTSDDVIAAWAGIRPLAAKAHAGDASSASREHLIETGRSGVITVTGGKLTTFRVIARDVVDAAFRALGRQLPRGGTDRIPLAGGDVRDLEAEMAAARAAPAPTTLRRGSSTRTAARGIKFGRASRTILRLRIASSAVSPMSRPRSRTPWTPSLPARSPTCSSVAYTSPSRRATMASRWRRGLRRSWRRDWAGPTVASRRRSPNMPRSWIRPSLSHPKWRGPPFI